MRPCKALPGQRTPSRSGIRVAEVFDADRNVAGIPLPGRMRLWDQLVAEWRLGCVDAGLPATVTDDERALWALEQHHGLPTRMLDWSMSPYLAAFSAFRYAMGITDHELFPDLTGLADLATMRAALAVTHRVPGGP